MLSDFEYKLLTSAIESTDTKFLTERLDAIIANLLITDSNKSQQLVTIANLLSATRNWIYLSHSTMVCLVDRTQNTDLSSKAIMLGTSEFFLGLLNPKYQGNKSILRGTLANPRYQYIHKHLQHYLKD